MSDLTVCDTKQAFDTEFEATLACARMEHKYGEEFEPYQCLPNRHWHVTHVDLTLRRGVGHKYWRCPKCKVIVKSNKAAKHKCVIKEIV